MADARTLAAYAARATDYSDRFDRPEPDAQLAAFIAALPNGARALDLGCGTGRSSMLMRQAGLTVDAIDASPEFAAMAKDRFGVDVTVATFDSLEESETYDGIFANFSLLHARKADLPDHLDRVHRALLPGGLFHIGLKTGQGEARDAIGRFYAYYTDDGITGLLEDACFRVTERWTGESEGLDGTIAGWIILHARKIS